MALRPDLFVTHDWRRSVAFDAALAVLDAAFGLDWRCFSNPWHDPILRPANAADGALLTKQLRAQVAPSHAVLLLPDVWSDGPRGRRWATAAVEQANELGRAIIGLSDEPASLPIELRVLARAWVPWSAEAVRDSLAVLLIADPPAGRPTAHEPV